MMLMHRIQDFSLIPDTSANLKQKNLIFELNGEHRWDVDMCTFEFKLRPLLLQDRKIVDEAVYIIDKPKI